MVVLSKIIYFLIPPFLANNLVVLLSYSLQPLIMLTATNIIQLTAALLSRYIIINEEYSVNMRGCMLPSGGAVAPPAPLSYSTDIYVSQKKMHNYTQFPISQDTEQSD